MKKFTQIIVFFLVSFNVIAQSPFDKALSEISNDLAEKLNLKNKKTVVVLYINDINKNSTVAGKYFADIISDNIVNSPVNIKVFNRENLKEIIEAKKMIDEGYITASKAQELGKLLSVEGIIIGSYTILSNTIKLSVKIIDVNDGFSLASSLKDLPLNADAGALLGIDISTNGINATNTANRGFNGRPLNSNESYNNPETVSKICQQNNTGDFCFTNNTKILIEITLITQYAGTVGRITIDPGQTQCFYNIHVASGYYTAEEANYRFANPEMKFSRRGSVLIEQCKSKTAIIK
jgi:TolB-like protein